MSIREKRKLRNLIVALLLFFSGWFLFSPWGLIKFYRVNNELAEIKKTNRELEENNRMLEEEIEKLTKDPDYIEEIARKKFGLIKKNELVFDFSKKKK